MAKKKLKYYSLKRLLELEIPEINDGIVILYSVAREAGVRSIYNSKKKNTRLLRIKMDRFIYISSIIPNTSSFKIYWTKSKRRNEDYYWNL